MSVPDLDKLMALLEVEVVALSECRVSAGLDIEIGRHAAVGIHYVLDGTGRLGFDGASGLAVGPHTLIVVPPRVAFRLASTAGGCPAPGPAARGGPRHELRGGVNRFSVGDTAPRTVMICGHFEARYGGSTGLFDMLAAPIVETFAPADRIDQRLLAALDELLRQEVGAGAMSAALLKQVLVTLLRRSLASLDTWVQRFALLSDPQVARAFAAMVADPGAPHSVESLAGSAFLSRSAFMSRFSAAAGRSPMLVLRDLRMRLAAGQLAAGAHALEQVVRNAGYSSRSSFSRAFRKVHGTDPTGFRRLAAGSR